MMTQDPARGQYVSMYPADSAPVLDRHPFRKGDGWLVWGVLGVIAAPVVVAATAYAITALGYPQV